MVIGQGHDPGGQLDARGPFTRRGQEHFGRGDHFPAAGMVLAAPEFVISELVQVLHEVEIAAELQHRVLADGMVGGEEGAKIQTRHDAVSWLVMVRQQYKADGPAAITDWQGPADDRPGRQRRIVTDLPLSFPPTPIVSDHGVEGTSRAVSCVIQRAQFIAGRRQGLWAQGGSKKAPVFTDNEPCHGEEIRRVPTRFDALQSLINGASIVSAG